MLDNKQPQKLLSFRAVEAKGDSADAAHVLIVVDMINTGFGVVAREREELSEFLKSNGGELQNPTALAVLAESGLKLGGGWTRDGSTLQAAFGKQSGELRTVGRDAGIYGAAERLEMSLNQLAQLAGYEAAQPGRKVILFISPGWPMLYVAGDQSDLKQRTWVFNQVVRLTNGFLDGNITLYVIDPFDLGRTDPFYYQAYLKGVAFPKDAEYPNLALQVLAVHSGGQVLVSGRDVTGELKTAIRDASASYELTFAAAPGDRVEEYHALQVKVDKPDAVVRTTAGYYARANVASAGR